MIAVRDWGTHPSLLQLIERSRWLPPMCFEDNYTLWLVIIPLPTCFDFSFWNSEPQVGLVELIVEQSTHKYLLLCYAMGSVLVRFWQGSSCLWSQWKTYGTCARAKSRAEFTFVFHMKFPFGLWEAQETWVYGVGLLCGTQFLLGVCRKIKNLPLCRESHVPK